MAVMDFPKKNKGQNLNEKIENIKQDPKINVFFFSNFFKNYFTCLYVAVKDILSKI